MSDNINVVEQDVTTNTYVDFKVIDHLLKDLDFMRLVHDESKNGVFKKGVLALISTLVEDGLPSDFDLKDGRLLLHFGDTLENAVGIYAMLGRPYFQSTANALDRVVLNVDERENEMVCTLVTLRKCSTCGFAFSVSECDVCPKCKENPVTPTLDPDTTTDTNEESAGGEDEEVVTPTETTDTNVEEKEGDGTDQPQPFCEGVSEDVDTEQPTNSAPANDTKQETVVEASVDIGANLKHVSVMSSGNVLDMNLKSCAELMTCLSVAGLPDDFCLNGGNLRLMVEPVTKEPLLCSTTNPYQWVELRKDHFKQEDYLEVRCRCSMCGREGTVENLQWNAAHDTCDKCEY